jgi:DNA modification methylase
MSTRLPAYQDEAITVYQGDVCQLLAELPASSVDCCVTSPPYWGLRDYGIPPQVWGGDRGCRHDWSRIEDGRGKEVLPVEDSALGSGPFCSRCGAWRGHLGLEPTPDLFVEHMVDVFREVRRVLKPSGTLWLNLGDCYNAGTSARRQPSLDRVGYWQAAGSMGDRRVKADGLKPKDLVGIPWRVALALQSDGWYLRADIVWAKPNPMPESISDRPTRAHEYVFLLSRSARYFYDAEAVREPAVSTAMKTPSGWDTAPGGHGSFHRSGRGSAGHLSVQVPADRRSRNRRTVWTIPTQPYRGAHFATFPERLVEPCVLAGTSAAGCCSNCGTPWRRLIDVAYRNPGNRTTNGPRSLDRRSETAGFAVRRERMATTAGWVPGCSCDAPPVAALVLDPFAGSGTTLAVAKRLGRSGLGIELNRDYIGLLRARCRAVVSTPDQEAV